VTFCTGSDDISDVELIVVVLLLLDLIWLESMFLELMVSNLMLLEFDVDVVKHNPGCEDIQQHHRQESQACRK
jgi:hypothetical protein